MKAEDNRPGGTKTPGCNVNSRLNYTIGTLAVAAALLLTYVAYVIWWK